MIEEWKDIKNFEGKYQVSNLGRVRSLYDQNQFKKTYRTKLLKFGKRAGYYVVNLQNCKERKSCQVHRLVAQAFIPNQNNNPVVNHIDENRLNNRVDNLEWCTQKENVIHSKYQFYKPKRRCKLSSSGEKYIIKRNRCGRTYYEVCIPKRGKKIYMGQRNTLEEAVILRNENYLKEEINNV